MSIKVLGKGKRFSRERRHNRVRFKVSGTSTKPRLMVLKSLRNTNAILVDDSVGKTLGFAASASVKSGDKTAKAKEVGKLIAKVAADNKIKEVVFDKGASKYHGRVEAVAVGAREAGLKF